MPRRTRPEFTTPTLYKLNAIYLSSDGRTAEEVEALKAAVDAKLKSGASFPDTAAELSDPPMKVAKGDLGSFKTGELETALEAPLERLKSGEKTPWINNKNAWYLLLLRGEDGQLPALVRRGPQRGRGEALQREAGRQRCTTQAR